MSNNSKTKLKSFKELPSVLRKYKILTGYYKQRLDDIYRLGDFETGINKYGIAETFFYDENTGKFRKFELLCPTCYTEFFKANIYKDSYICIHGHEHLAVSLYVDEKRVSHKYNEILLKKFGKVLV